MPTTRAALLTTLLFVTTTFAGCASEPVVARADGGAPVCTKTYPTGSNLATTTCVSPDQQRTFDRDSMRIPGQARPSGGGG